MTDKHRFIRHDLLELAAAYAEYSVLVTTAELQMPGPQILYANAAFTRMTGYAVGELLGKTPRILQGPKTDPELLKRLRCTLEDGKDFIARAINYKRDGTPFELEWVISHLRDSEGRTTHYIAIQRDITGIQRAAANLDQFDAELRDASQHLTETVDDLELAERKLADRERLTALGEMAAGVVHDIGNALTPVFCLVELLHSMDSIPPEAQSLVVDLDASVEHAVEILANLKRHYHSGSSVGALEAVELTALLHRLPDITRARCWALKRKGKGEVNFAFELPGTTIVSGNRTELLQVFVNLALNAIDAMSDGGTITVSLKTVAENAVVSISDTGVGMSEELLKTCFEPYVTTNPSGTGLGLSVCRRIIELHNGAITASNAKPHGVTFTIRIPLFCDVDRVESGTGGNERLRVLSICGDRERQLQVKTLLQSLGAGVSTAESGDEGLKQFYESDFDLIITDSSLRPTSGFDVAQAVKRTSPHIPVAIFVTPKESNYLSSLPEHLQPNAVLPVRLTQANLENTLAQLGLWDSKQG